MIARETIGRDTRDVCHVRRLTRDQWPARPTPNSLGLAMTIGIAAAPLSMSGRPFIVTVTDMRESFGEELQGIDIGRTKAKHVARDWGFLFAGGDARYAGPIARAVRAKLGDGSMHEPRTLADVQEAICSSYREFREEFVVKKFLSPLHY